MLRINFKEAKSLKSEVARNAIGQWEWQIRRQYEYSIDVGIFAKYIGLVCLMLEMIPQFISQENGR